MSYPIFYLDVDIVGCDAGVYVNGAPVLAAWHRETSRAAPTVSEWILPAGNELAVSIVGPSASEVGTMRVRVALCRGQAGDVVEPGRGHELCSVTWQPDPSGAPALPMILRAQADVTHPWGAWRWSTAPLLADDATTHGEVTAALRLIHAPLLQGNARMLLAASQVKLEEVGRCYAIDPSAARARFRSVWSALNATPGFRVAPLDADRLVFRRYCGDRLLVPMTTDGEAAIRQYSDDGSGWSLPLFFARVDGLLAVVR